MPSKWIRLAESRQFQVLVASLDLAHEDLPGDPAGIWINTTGTSLKVHYRVWERDKKGRKHTRQRTKNFRRDRDYEEGDELDAALAFKRRMDHAYRAGSVSRSEEPLTVADAFERFMRAKDRRPTTVENYRALYGKWIGPRIGTWLVSDLTPQDIEEWSASLTDAGPGAKQHAEGIVKAVLEHAARQGLIPTNPARVLRTSSHPTRSIRADEIPTDEQIDALASAVGERYRALIYLLAYGGLRIGEAIALRVDRVDFLRRRITIDQSASEVGGKLVFGPTKTGSSTRTIAVPAFLVDLLAEHIAAFPTENGLIFSSAGGGPIRAGNFRKRIFQSAAERIGMAGMHIHDLRHTAASHLAADGANAVEIASRLGHANAAITQRIYLHLLESRDSRLADLQEERWRRRQGG